MEQVNTWGREAPRPELMVLVWGLYLLGSRETLPCRSCEQECGVQETIG